MTLATITRKRQKISMLDRGRMLEAAHNRDASHNGKFYIAVKTTGIVCLPEGKCGGRPKDENLEFFETLEAALDAGYRPCKRCFKEMWHDGDWSR